MRIEATALPSGSAARESNHRYSVFGLWPTAATRPVTV